MAKKYKKKYLILASSSPRRRYLFSMLHIPFKTVKPRIDESFIRGESPTVYVKRLSLKKAIYASIKYPSHWVIGADTIVVLDGLILGKPANREEAVRILRLLSGKTHAVFTGVTVMMKEKNFVLTEVKKTLVTFRQFSRKEAEFYVLTGEPLDKAGAYGAQGMGMAFIEKINGCFSNVIGMPLSLLINMLFKAGAIKISSQKGRIYTIV